MKIKPQDLNMLKSLARDSYLRIGSGARVEGMTGQMSHGDKLAVAFLEASVRLFLKLNMQKEDLVDLTVPLEFPDSDPAAEEHDWIAEESPE